MNLVEELFHQVAKIVGSHNLSWGDNHIDLSKKFHRKPFLEVLSEATGHSFDEFDEEKISKICKEAGIELEENSNLGCGK